MNELNPELTYEEIPQGLLDELATEWGDVVFDLGSDVTETTRTFRTHYEEKDGELCDGAMCDEQSFAPIAIRGYKTTWYLVRFDDAINTVRKVVQHSSMTAEEVLGPIEPKQDASVQ